MYYDYNNAVGCLDLRKFIDFVTSSREWWSFSRWGFRQTKHPWESFIQAGRVLGIFRNGFVWFGVCWKGWFCWFRRWWNGFLTDDLGGVVTLPPHCCPKEYMGSSYWSSPGFVVMDENYLPAVRDRSETCVATRLISCWAERAGLSSRKPLIAVISIA